MKPEVQAVLTARVNIDILPQVVNNQVVGIGLRLRPYGKQAVKDVMILAYGATFDKACEDAYEKAYANRWESLSWAARPWASDDPPEGINPFSGPGSPF